MPDSSKPLKSSTHTLDHGRQLWWAASTEIDMRVASLITRETAEVLFGMTLALSLFAMAYLVMAEA
ncbi:hypothetical protein SNE35_31405 [Paucibacter sp. R3-3]|uniref:Uncharacterized protein n=1 Tax=Roseateles agri TaxID=3098619 RepID=A0ABU5DRU4_9BURK|nr:hypothetical protein [Paucibacter sp. R3-3]MDY0749046.1 hypothetical protein [Paucibacter sp. R3-3]